MFQHLTLLFSFIFAMAFSHILASVSALIAAKERVRFSGLHALWMTYATAGLLLNWISLLALESLKRWSIGEILLQLGWAIPQYFTCSLVSIKIPESGEVDVGAIYERRRPALFSAYLLMIGAILIQQYVDRNNLEGWGPNDWIGADLLAAPLLILAPIAGWAKPRWLQWIAACLSLAMLMWLYVSYGSLSIQR